MPDGVRPGPLAGASPSAHLLTLANAITLARLCMVPAVVWLVLRERFAIAFWLFACAGVSDAVDGWLARRRGPSALGTLLDPMADKALLVSLYVSLAAVRALPDWLAILVVFRDLVIVGGVLTFALLGHKIVIRPLRISKLNTMMQIVLVMLALLQAGYGAMLDRPEVDIVLTVLIWAVGVTTISSGAAYVVQGARLR